jgi:GNAT superfamily N-acetyltransferase
MPQIAELLDAYDAQLRPAEVTNLPEGARAEQDGPITRVVGQHRGFISSPRDLGIDGEALDALIARQKDFFGARGEPVEWKTRAHDLPPGIVQRLERAGFIAEGPETVMIGMCEEISNISGPSPAGVSIRQAWSPQDMSRISAMESEVWGEDWGWLADDLNARLRKDGNAIVVLVAEAGGKVVSAGWAVHKKGTEFAALWGGSTLEAWRGKGIYRALVAERAQVALRWGCRYLQVDASPDSRPILEKLGFVAVTETTPYVWSPS